MDFRLLRHLYYFLTVAEEMHFGRAARRLGITQPPLSAQIKVLEQFLGAELFERSGSGVRLTQAGQAIVPLVKSLVDHAGRLEGLVQAAKAGQTVSITVGATNSALFDPLGAALSVARTELPGLRVTPIEMKSAEALDAVRRREVDLALSWVDTPPPPLSGFSLDRKRLVLACRQDHPLASKPQVSLRDLEGEPLVMCDRRIGPDYGDTINAICQRHGLTQRVEHVVRSISAQVAMVHCGSGLAIVPENATHYSAVHVVYRQFVEDTRQISLMVVWNPDRDMSPLDGFLDILRRY